MRHVAQPLLDVSATHRAALPREPP